jgi:hypothetical protein
MSRSHPESEANAGFDVILAHDAPEKPWVQILVDELARLGLRAFLNFRELARAENWTLRLS